MRNINRKAKEREQKKGEKTQEKSEKEEVKRRNVKFGEWKAQAVIKAIV